MYIYTFTGRKSLVGFLEYKTIFCRKLFLVSTLKILFFDFPSTFLNVNKNNLVYGLFGMRYFINTREITK